MEKEKIKAIYLKSLLRTNEYLFKKTEDTPSLQILTHTGWKIYQYSGSLSKFSVIISKAIDNRHNFIIQTLKNKQPLKCNNDIFNAYLDTHEEDNRNGKFVFYLVILLDNGAVSDYTFTRVENFLDILEILIRSNIFFELDAQFVEDK